MTLCRWSPIYGMTCVCLCFFCTIVQHVCTASRRYTVGVGEENTAGVFDKGNCLDTVVGMLCT